MLPPAFQLQLKLPPPPPPPSDIQQAGAPGVPSELSSLSDTEARKDYKMMSDLECGDWRVFCVKINVTISKLVNLAQYCEAHNL